MHSLNVPCVFIKKWPEHGWLELKHAANCVLKILCIWYDMIWHDMIWYDIWYDMIWWYDMICLLTAIGLPPGGSSTEHVYTQTIHGTTQLTIGTTQLTIGTTQLTTRTTQLTKNDNYKQEQHN